MGKAEIQKNIFETILIDIDFSAESQKDIEITIKDRIAKVYGGRLYIDVDPGSPFSAFATYGFYSKAAKKGEDCFYRTAAKLVYTELEVATSGSNANITPDDHTDFSPNDLALILNDPVEFIRLQTIADTMIAEDIIGAHVIDIGLVRVSEFSDFSLYNEEDENKVYLRVSFASPQTVSLKMELKVRR